LAHKNTTGIRNIFLKKDVAKGTHINKSISIEGTKLMQNYATCKNNEQANMNLITHA
jgi:hypothetical protein